VYGISRVRTIRRDLLSRDWDYIAFDEREVRIVFDSDVMTKRQVRAALDRLTAHLQRKGAKVRSVYLSGLDDKGKVGVDDWLAAGHTVQELEKQIEAPRLVPKPAPPKVELLDEAPQIMNRPLMIINGDLMQPRAYLSN